MLPIKLDFKALAVGLTKAGAKLVTGDADGALNEAREAVLKGKALNPEEAVQQLVSVALLKSSLHIIDPLRLVWKEEWPAWVIKNDVNDIVGKATACEIKLDPDFFSHLDTLPAMLEFQHLLVRWIEKAGGGANSAHAAVRLRWVFAETLAREYQTNPSAYVTLDQYLTSAVAEHWRLENSWERSKLKFMHRLHDPLFGEPYSLPQLYVEPLAFITTPVTRHLGKSHSSSDTEPAVKRTVVKLFDELTNWLGSDKRGDAVRVITGQLGSGKSSSARMWAAERLSFNHCRVLFIPLHELNLDDHSFDAALEEYAKHSGAPKDLLDETRSPSRLLLILDGLDELSKHGDAGKSAAASFVDEVMRVVSLRNGSALRLNVLFCGRPIATQQITERFKDPGQVLELLPFFVDVDSRVKYDAPTRGLLTQDYRERWWLNYAAITGQSGPIPSELTHHQLADITAQPLHCHLVAIALRDGPLVEGDKVINPAKVYDRLLRKVYDRAWGEHTAARPGHPSTQHFDTYEKFRDVIAVLGVAAIQSGGRGASLKDVQALADRAEQAEALDECLARFRSDLATLCMSFYFRFKGRVHGTEPTFEFTHKSFGEYLYAIHLVNAATLMTDSLGTPMVANRPNGAKYTAEDRLKLWLTLAGPAEITHEIDRFLFGEVQLRAAAPLPSIDGQKMRQALETLLRTSLEQGMPGDNLTGLPFRQMTRQANNAEHALTQLLGACATAAARPDWRESAEKDNRSPTPGWISISMEDVANDQRVKDHAARVERNDGSFFQSKAKSPTWAADFLRRVRPPRGRGYGQLPSPPPLNLLGWNLSHQWLLNCDLASALLDGAILDGAILDGASLHRASLTGASLRRASLAGASLYQANLTGASLDRANLDRAILHGTKLQGGILDGASMDGARLDEARLDGASMDGARLDEARLDGASLTNASLDGASLYGARLHGARLDGARLDGARLDGASFDGASMVEASLHGASLYRATYGSVGLDTDDGRALLREKGAII